MVRWRRLAGRHRFAVRRCSEYVCSARLHSRLRADDGDDDSGDDDDDSDDDRCRRVVSGSQHVCSDQRVYNAPPPPPSPTAKRVDLAAAAAVAAAATATATAALCDARSDEQRLIGLTACVVDSWFV